MNKKIALSALSILATLSLVAGSSFALFTDVATSNDNTFSTGNASLLIAEDVPPADPGDYFELIAGVSISGMAPGDVVTKDFWLKNDSTAEITMNLTADLNDLGGTTPGDLPNELLVKFTCDTDENGIGGSDTVTTEQSVNAWIAGSPESIGSVGPSEGASNATSASDQDELLCRMTATLPSDVENDLAGKDVSFDGVFNGTQVVL